MIWWILFALLFLAALWIWEPSDWFDGDGYS